MFGRTKAQKRKGTVFAVLFILLLALWLFPSAYNYLPVPPQSEDRVQGVIEGLAVVLLAIAILMLTSWTGLGLLVGVIGLTLGALLIYRALFQVRRETFVNDGNLGYGSK